MSKSKKIVLGVLVVLVATMFVLVWWSGKKDTNKKKEDTKKTTTITCSKTVKTKDGNSNLDKQVSIINAKNKLIRYEDQKSITYKTNTDYDKACKKLTKKYASSGKGVHDYYTYSLTCSDDNRTVEIKEMYETSTMDGKEDIPNKLLQKKLNKKYILKVKSYKKAAKKDGYTCK